MSSIHFAEGVHFKENYHSTITFQYSMDEGGPSFLGGEGVHLFPGGWWSNCIFLYRPIDLVILQGVRSGLPAPSTAAARGIVNLVRPHIA